MFSHLLNMVFSQGIIPFGLLLTGGCYRDIYVIVQREVGGRGLYGSGFSSQLC